MPADAPSSLAESLNLANLIADLMGDLRALREGKISNRDAHARAELARQILRGVHYVVQAQKFLSLQALPNPDAEGK
jgi:hypothetical protein